MGFGPVGCEGAECCEESGDCQARSTEIEWLRHSAAAAELKGRRSAWREREALKRKRSQQILCYNVRLENVVETDIEEKWRKGKGEGGLYPLDAWHLTYHLDHVMQNPK